jgi:hypothetical protein
VGEVEDHALLEALDAIEDPAELAELVKAERAAGRDVSFFSCGGPRPTCYRCSGRAVKRCDGPGKAAGETCGRLLCGEHARGSRCSQHAPETTSPTMPKPPGRARGAA